MSVKILKSSVGFSDPAWRTAREIPTVAINVQQAQYLGVEHLRESFEQALARSFAEKHTMLHSFLWMVQGLLPNQVREKFGEIVPKLTFHSTVFVKLPIGDDYHHDMSEESFLRGGFNEVCINAVGRPDHLSAISYIKSAKEKLQALKLSILDVGSPSTVTWHVSETEQKSASVPIALHGYYDIVFPLLGFDATTSEETTFLRALEAASVLTSRSSQGSVYHISMLKMVLLTHVLTLGLTELAIDVKPQEWDSAHIVAESIAEVSRELEESSLNDKAEASSAKQ